MLVTLNTPVRRGGFRNPRLAAAAGLVSAGEPHLTFASLRRWVTVSPGATARFAITSSSLPISTPPSLPGDQQRADCDSGQLRLRRMESGGSPRRS